MEAIKTRRSGRRYSDRPVEEEKLRQVLEAARLSPSSQNGQNWHFIVVRDKEKIRQLMDAADGQPHWGRPPAPSSPAARSAAYGLRPAADTIDCAIAMSYMILEATLSVSAPAGSAIFTPTKSKSAQIRRM
jgi:nitroreductase